MSDSTKKFHEFALKSSLFKGRTAWYFCYLKSERIVQVLATLALSAKNSHLNMVIIKARKIPESILYFAAGTLDRSLLLADIFSLISTLRICETEGIIQKENVFVLITEYEAIAERMENEMGLSSFVSSNDFSIPLTLNEKSIAPTVSSSHSPQGQLKGAMKNPDKGHSKGQGSFSGRLLKDQEDRRAKILNFVRDSQGVSIKDIANIVRTCSEKTIQRELSLLIREGEITKVGERRWSIYLPTSSNP